MASRRVNFDGKTITYFGCKDCGQKKNSKGTLRIKNKWCNKNCMEFVLYTRMPKHKRKKQEFPHTKKCIACGSKAKWHKHHITYTPEKTVRLCIPCHYIITSLNTERRNQLDRPLKNSERYFIFRQFMKDRTDKNKLKFHYRDGKAIFDSHKADAQLTNEFLAIVNA